MAVDTARGTFQYFPPCKPTPAYIPPKRSTVTKAACVSGEDSDLMNPMVSGLSGGKGGSSDPRPKIDLVNDEATIRKKIAKAVCAPRVTEGNGILAFIQQVLLPVSGLRSADGVPSARAVLKDQKEPTTFTDFEQVTAAYQADLLTPQIAKAIVQNGLVALIEPIRVEFAADGAWQDVAREASPDQIGGAGPRGGPGKEKSQGSLPVIARTPDRPVLRTAVPTRANTANRTGSDESKDGDGRTSQ
ncbi:hypothetical protein B0H67DRAFT_284376 [Lasiosphaeris hirsuta]|uniref:tyrosine--tRNA ligase n=1 Tax=Lasiosphaeris hirsuta TaxID=260670 RepID=A0AA40DTG6_9PEZI|nr:hypothetical protein B0H67DRAFT_284376 [Lasiosphaeris hirsuta]